MRNGHTTVKLFTCDCGRDMRIPRREYHKSLSWTKRRTCAAYRCGKRYRIVLDHGHDPDCPDFKLYQLGEGPACYQMTHLLSYLRVYELERIPA
jgi:hypothetical protein